MLTSCGPQRLLTTCTSWARTRSSFGTVRSWPSHSRARLRPRAKNAPSFRGPGPVEQIRATDQPKNSEADRSDDSAECAGEGGPGHKMTFWVGEGDARK